MSSKRLRNMLLAMAAFACASPGQACTGAPEVTIKQDEAGSTVTLCPGQRLTVRLRGNPTTGFVWDALPGAEWLLARRGDPQFTADSSAPGAGGVYRFAFQATSVGKAPLEFVYHRPFEQGSAPARTFQVTVEVTD